MGSLTEGVDIMDHEQPMLPQLQELFDSIVGESGSIVLMDLEYALEDEETASYFQYLLVDVTDANILFRLLDINRDFSVDANEFIAGLEQLQVRRASAETLSLAGCKKALEGSLALFVPEPPRPPPEKKEK